MHPVRPEEPAYARLPPADGQTVNQWGKAIRLVEEAHPLAGQSLNINGDPGIGQNPDRHKQHGFFFTADNCIGCHACEAACSEKNDLPAHLSFRSVGYVEGGSYPAYQRLNISMACNHCDDPVCLKGCPTRAYTKFAEYGAVLQDPDICFGCGYCTWVCPYNAPQLDPIKGQVSKCNMCVDRLEVGLKPACAAACLGGALDFGVIETKPENREQARLQIPGFPTPEITHPNIRFQQKKTLPLEMTRPDDAPIKYRRDDPAQPFHPAVDQKHGAARQWNLGKLLGTHENAHIAFTLSAQTAMGAFAALTLSQAAPESALAAFATGPAHLPTLLGLVVVLSFGMARLNLHLGKPHRFYRGFNNWRLSPVSREIAGVSLFFAGLAGALSFEALAASPLTAALAQLSTGAALLGLVVGGYYMIRLYRIPARPFWNHGHTDAAFTGTALSLGGLSIALAAWAQGALTPELASTCGMLAASGLGLEGTGLIAHARAMRALGNEGAAAHYEQTTRYGWPYLLRGALLVAALGLAAALGATGEVRLILPLAIALLTQSVLGRALFYVVVIPTTLPGAFFWRNQGFAEHARESGLARLPQVGVLPENH